MKIRRTKHRYTAITCTMLLFCAALSGCSRSYYRTQADCDAYWLVHQKSKDPRWAIDHFSIEPNPASRMYDPAPPDAPPMPPDDPTAHRLMHCVDCRRGYPCWHKFGDTPYVENPAWATYLPADKEGQLRLDRRAAVELSLLNSTDFQSELEDLYLSALDVSFERFRFDAQFFAGYQGFFSLAGGPNASSELDLSTRNPAGGRSLQMRKLFASGGELVVGLANSLMWEFSGPNRHAALTVLDFSLVQPLLRGGSRARVLERLTVSERALLANVRQMQRFRRGFYGEIVAGLDSGGGPTRRGGLQGGAGLEGFAGVGAGGFGRLGGIGLGGATGAGAAEAGGFFGLLQDLQEIRNQESNVLALRNSLTQLQALFEAGGRIDFFQVELARQALYNAQSRLLTRKVGYEASLDNYKIELGLPPSIDAVIDDPMLDGFQLIDPTLRETELQGEQLLNVLREPDLQVDESSWSRLLDRADEFFEKLGTHVGNVKSDLESLEENLPARRQNLQQLADREELERGEVEQNPYNVEKLNQRVERDMEDYAKLLRHREAVRSRLEALTTPSDLKTLIGLTSEMMIQLNDILLLQARIRLDTIVIVPLELEPPTALKIASDNRLDWMNARAALVDAWRLIEFNANDLESDLDIVIEGERNISSGTDSRRLRFGLEFDAPIPRLAERNIYRQSLIEYQQARRSFYTYVDRVDQGLRGTLRNIRLDQLNLELRREAVQLAISQVELARLQLEEPPKPGAIEVAGSDNRVQNLVGALSELLDAQNDFLSVWLNYQVLRISLDFQMGTMQLDDHGMWIDPGPIPAGTSATNADEP